MLYTKIIKNRLRFDWVIWKT